MSFAWDIERVDQTYIQEGEGIPIYYQNCGVIFDDDEEDEVADEAKDNTEDTIKNFHEFHPEKEIKLSLLLERQASKKAAKKQISLSEAQFPGRWGSKQCLP